MLYEVHALIDTSALIQLRMEWYSPDVFPSLNRSIEMAAQHTKLVTVDRVVEELKTQASTRASTSEAEGAPTIEQTWRWAVTVLPLIEDFVHHQTIADIAKLTADIARDHQRWSRGQPADPMLVAAAEVLNCAVISGEAAQMHDRHDPKPISESADIRNESGLYSSWVGIPDICMLRDIQHHDLLSFFRTQDWSF